MTAASTVLATYTGPEIETNERVIPCESCGGDGEFNEPYFRSDHSVGNRHSKCTACAGTGEQVIELEPVTLEDLEEADV